MSPQKPTFSQRKAEQLAPSQSIVMCQTWSDLLFLHWEFDQNIIQAKIPKGLYVDCYKGKAYLGIAYSTSDIERCYLSIVVNDDFEEITINI